MDVFANSLGAVSALAVILEQVVEFLAKPLVPVKYRVVIPYAALVLGLGAAFAFSLDLITPLLATFDVTPAVDWAGKLLTGLLMGRGSNLVHDLWPKG